MSEDATTPDRAGAPTAVVLLSFGGPRGNDDVMPFLENVTRGRGIPRERLLGVAEHYYDVGGVSPINEHNEALRAALSEELDCRGATMPVYWGNRNWDPYLAQAFARAYDDGHRHVLVLATSAYPSYSGCRQYREDIAAALAACAADGKPLDVSKIDHYHDTDGFRAANAAAVQRAVDDVADTGDVHVAFVTHSIPTSMAAASGPSGGEYVTTHEAVAQSVMERVTGPHLSWSLVYCSRSGPPQMPWLEPDINDHIVSRGEPGIVVAPIGFISDHMEVVYDLDVEAAQTAAEQGKRFARAATVGTDPAFVRSLADLIAARQTRVCPATCCPNARRPDTPAACQVGGTADSGAAAGGAA